MADRRTGYYVAGRDWPAISNNIPLEEIYSALERIDQNAVDVALKSLRQDGNGRKAGGQAKA